MYEPEIYECSTCDRHSTIDKEEGWEHYKECRDFIIHYNHSNYHIADISLEKAVEYWVLTEVLPKYNEIDSGCTIRIKDTDDNSKYKCTVDFSKYITIDIDTITPIKDSI